MSAEGRASGAPAQQSQPAIEAVGLSKRFGKIVAVDALDLALPGGERIPVQVLATMPALERLAEIGALLARSR